MKNCSRSDEIAGVSSDIMGGIEFGMKSCFYNSRKEFILNGLKVDYEITSLEEIQQFA